MLLLRWRQLPQQPLQSLPLPILLLLLLRCRRCHAVVLLTLL
jgi:hypothetical protein